MFFGFIANIILALVKYYFCTEISFLKCSALGDVTRGFPYYPHLVDNWGNLRVIYLFIVIIFSGFIGRSKHPIECFSSLFFRSGLHGKYQNRAMCLGAGIYLFRDWRFVFGMD